MGEKDCGGHLDWRLVCGYIPVNAQGAHWEGRCIPVKAQGDQWDCGCIPDRACERTGSPVGLYCLWRWTWNPAGLSWVCVREGDVGRLECGFVLLYSIPYSIFYILSCQIFNYLKRCTIGAKNAAQICNQKDGRFEYSNSP